MTLRTSAGYSLIEMVALMAVLGIGTSVAIPNFKSSGIDLDNAGREVAGNYRLARMLAISRGTHYSVQVIDDATFRVARLRQQDEGDPDSSWVIDGSDFRFVSLPKTVRFASAPGFAVEFDSAGGLSGTDEMRSIVVRNRGSGGEKTVGVWPSGQIDAGAR